MNKEIFKEKLIPDTSWDWEEQGYDSQEIQKILEQGFKGEIENIRLYKDTGSRKWIFLGDYHNQPRILSVCRYDSPDYFDKDHRRIKELSKNIPQYFPFVENRCNLKVPSNKRKLNISVLECLAHMNTAWEFREKFPEKSPILAQQEGYLVGFVLGKTGLTITDPHPNNTLVYEVSPGELILKFVDGERFQFFPNFKDSLNRTLEEYSRIDSVRSEILKNWAIFNKGITQGLEDSKENYFKKICVK